MKYLNELFNFQNQNNSKSLPWLYTLCISLYSLYSLINYLKFFKIYSKVSDDLELKVLCKIVHVIYNAFLGYKSYSNKDSLYIILQQILVLILEILILSKSFFGGFSFISKLSDGWTGLIGITTALLEYMLFYKLINVRIKNFIIA